MRRIYQERIEICDKAWAVLVLAGVVSIPDSSRGLKASDLGARAMDIIDKQSVYGAVTEKFKFCAVKKRREFLRWRKARTHMFYNP